MNGFPRRLLVVIGLLVLASSAFAQDKNFYIYLCFGQSNMDGYPGLLDEDKLGVDPRFQVLAAVDFPKMDRKKDQWYTAVPPLCRPGNGICPADYFGRTLVAKLPAEIKVGVVMVAVPGCKIELFNDGHFQAYADAAPGWMKGVIAIYGGNPYQYLLARAREAQKAGVIKGILLHQGESNSDDPEWAAQVNGVYQHLLHDLNLKAEDVPLIAGEVVGKDQKGVAARANYNIDALPKTIPTAHIVSSVGCEARPEDHLHFTPKGYRELGKRYGEAALQLLDVK